VVSNDVSIPDCIEAIDTAWLSRAVSVRYPGAIAESVEVVDAHSGTTGRVRLRVNWREGSGAPGALFGKLAPTDPIQRQMVIFTGMGRRESQFYGALAGESPVRVPAPIWSGWSDDASRYFMLLEDLAEAGCSFPSAKGDDARVHALAHAEGMIDTLAILHGHYWESPRFASDLAWVEAPMRSSYGPDLVAEGMKQFGDMLPESSHALARIYLDHTEAMCDLLDAGPQTLLHGDSHTGNTFIDQGRVGLLDWACTCRAPGLRDVSYYLCASAPTELRREHEVALIERYLAGLAAAGGVAASFDDAWRQYRRFAVCSWIAATVTAAAGSRMQALEVGMRAMDRATKAIVDLDTPGLLEEELGV
jgi:hypothetical protein